MAEVKPVKAPGAGKVNCRLCKCEHFTAKFPYKESLGGLEQARSFLLFQLIASSLSSTADDDLGTGMDTAPPPATSGGKYVPPSMRAGAGRGAGESMRGTGSREDLPTLRVTNISEDTQEN